MFTGIIDHCGTIARIEQIPDGLHLWIKHGFSNLELGESIAVDGICLTVAELHDDLFSCHLSPETLSITTGKNFTIGQSVNLERALLPTTRMGGHFVMGHVDQLASVKNIQQKNDFTEITFEGLDKEAKKFIIKKGSIAINGVSLTINDITEDGFAVMLVPHTLERTNLKKLQANTAVNIEFDMLARLIVKQLENAST